MVVRERALGALARLIHARPRVALAFTAAFFLLCVGWLGAGKLGFDSSQHAIVNPDDPEQVRLDRFAERFGAVNDLVVVLSGDGARAAADDLAPRIAALDVVGEVFYRFEPDRLGPNAVWYLGAERTEDLRKLLEAADRMLPKSDRVADPKPIAGLTAAVESLVEGIEAFLDGEVEAPCAVRRAGATSRPPRLTPRVLFAPTTLRA